MTARRIAVAQFPDAEETIQTSKPVVHSRWQFLVQILTFRYQGRQVGIVRGMSTLATGMSIIVILASAAAAQEQHAYSEYSVWSSGAFANGHAFASTMDGRNYELQTRYGRLIYWVKPFAVRWILEATPLAIVGDPWSRNGRRAYAYGIGGGPIGAQLNFVHYRLVEPFLTSGGGFLYFNHRMFEATQFNFTAQLGAGVQLFTRSRRASLDLGYKYHHISNANLGNRNPSMDSQMLFVGVSFLR
jgi:Lipid A 3-O-deacylase (PagL)